MSLGYSGVTLGVQYKYLVPRKETFDGIASRITDSLEAEMRSKLWTGSTLASGAALLLSGNET